MTKLPLLQLSYCSTHRCSACLQCLHPFSRVSSWSQPNLAHSELTDGDNISPFIVLAALNLSQRMLPQSECNPVPHFLGWLSKRQSPYVLFWGESHSPCLWAWTLSLKTGAHGVIPTLSELNSFPSCLLYKSNSSRIVVCMYPLPSNSSEKPTNQLGSRPEVCSQFGPSYIADFLQSYFFRLHLLSLHWPKPHIWKAHHLRLLFLDHSTWTLPGLSYFFEENISCIIDPVSSTHHLEGRYQ